jgi:pyruvate dehydrogenase E2 component (dihydrolipoamide acetyltransferase)
VTLPQLGETVTEGTITRWLKGVGDSVSRDEPLFEVSTDKVDSEVPSPAAGVLQQILVPEGETVAVGTPLAVIGESADAGWPPPSAAAPPPAPEPETAAAPAPAAPASPVAPPPPPLAPPPPPPPSASETPPPPPPTAPSAAPPPPPGFTVSTQKAPAFPAPLADTAVPAPPEPAGAPLLSPVVRRLMAEHGLSASDVAGTGLGGRITREDVLNHIDASHTTEQEPGAPVPAPREDAVPAPAPPAPPAPPAVPARPTSTAVSAAGDVVVPFSNVRRRTAEHMVRSKATSPHAFIATETDFENVERVRRAWGERFQAEEGFVLTYLPFIARATVEALRDFPNLNASVGQDALIVHRDVNLAIAVDLAFEGLIVPVIHRADEVTLRGLARRIRDLADRARSRQLSAADIVGGTITITNDGPFGTFFTIPIINQPQVAILATDGIKRRPVVVNLPDGSESIAIHSVGLLGMAWDHRAIDGAYVSSFLRRVADLLATRDWAAEL